MMTMPRLMKLLDQDLLDASGVHSAYEKYCGQLTLEDIFTVDAVYMAAHHCASGFMDRPDTMQFMKSPWINSLKLRDRVLSGKFKPAYWPRKTIIERGKPRVIIPPKFECKVVQKLICDYLIRPLLEPRMIPTNYASVRGGGTARMHDDILKALNKYGKLHPGAVVTMADFKHYFASIPVDKLMSILGRYITDKRLLALIRSFSPDAFGLSLGNELSQVPASFYPSSIDHYFKDRLAVPYFRYMDDMLFLSPSMEIALTLTDLFLGLAEGIGLAIPEKDVQKKIRHVEFGQNFAFCKKRYIFNKQERYYYRMINPNIPRTENRKLKRFRQKLLAGEITRDQIRLQYDGVRGAIASHPNTYRILWRLDERFGNAIK